MELLNKIRRRARWTMRSRSAPYVVTLTDFDHDGVRFEVSNRTEAYRVEEHGGETAYIRAMLSTLNQDDLLWDVGVCVGLVALHAGRRCEVVGFEPDPAFRQRVNRNLALNPGIEIKLLPYAISDDNGEATLFTHGSSGNSSSLRRQREEKHAVRVQARTMDTLVEQTGSVPTVVKLDIEGAEVLALRGAEQLMTSEHRPRLLFIEIHDTLIEAFDASGDDVRERLTAWGYTDVRYRAQRNNQEHLILGHG